MNTTITSCTIKMSNGTTRYFEAGAGPTVVLVHGAGLFGADNWLPVFPALAEHFHVLAPDCLGFGMTDGLDEPYSFGYLVDFLREFIDSTGIAPCDVIGHSMGGWLGVLLAYESPARLRRLVTVAGGGTATRPLANMVDWIAPSDEEVERSTRELLGEDPGLDEVLRDRLALTHDGQRTQRFRGLMAHMTNPETRARYNTLRRLPLVEVPTLVLWGSDDAVNALEMGETTHKLLPSSELVVVPGGSHRLPQEDPRGFAATVYRFLSDS